jgi:hypothetical protein
MVTYLPRSAWGARASRGGTALVASQVIGIAVHWPGMAKPINATGDAGKARVASALRGWQNYHMDVRGWSDIAYQIAVDQAGRAWTLRGLNIRSGANGDATVNRQYGAILLVLAPGEQPSDAMEATTRGVIADFRKRFANGTAIKPHSAVREEGTDCPGPAARAAIARGDFTPRSTPLPQEDDDMKLTDVIPGLTDDNGNPVTVAQALARGTYAYDQVTEGGSIDKRLDVVEGRITTNTDARAQYAYAAVTDGGSVISRLDQDEATLASLDQRLDKAEADIAALPKA